MQEAKWIWMDGEFVPWQEANVHILTHSLHYSGAVWEGIRCYDTEKGPAIFRLKEHMDRLMYSASVLQMDIPYSVEELIETAKKLISKNELTRAYIRPIIYFGYGKMGLNPTGAPIKVAMAAFPFGSYLGEGAAKVKISKYIRIHPKSTVADAKIAGHYSNSILASQEIHAEGYDEALFLDYKGNIAEGPGENIFLVKDGEVHTPELGSILGGITRATIITLLKDKGIPVHERAIHPDELFNADEAFFTGTAAEVTPIGQVDDKLISSGDLALKLKDEYEAIVNGQNPQYDHYLTYTND